MNLPFIKNFNKKILPSYFLVLILRDEKAQAVIFEEIEGKAKIIGRKEEYFSSSIDEASSDEFLEVLDKAISQAESSLPENIQTQKTIFGVKESWTDKDQIKKEYLAKLKKASEELGLTPIGFLVISQAISHLLQKEEGAPISAILAEVNRKTVTITLIRAGKIIETKSSEIHESIPFTVDTVLKHFNIPEILPSRIIIFNGKEDLTQEFISHTWSKSLPFLHLPQITNLPSGFDANSVLVGAAVQMGFEVLAEEMPQKSRLNEKHIENPDEISSENKTAGSDAFGFLRNIDVAKMPGEFQEKEGDIPQIPQAQEVSPTTTPYIKKAASILIAITNATLMLVGKINIKKILLFFSKIPKGKITILVPLILFVITALIASYFVFLKGTIEITVGPKIIERNKNILFSATDKTDSSKNIIKGEFVFVSEDGSVSIAATGKKDVGVNAKGSITIYNGSDISRTLAQGTILRASNGLEFTLDSPINIKAVASHSANENPPPEKTTANVTANQLGKESNFPSGTKFSVSSFSASDLIAINGDPFSGGTKKEVTVVSKNDSAKLEEDLPKQLENKAKETLKNRIGQNKILLPNFISKSLSKKSLNARIGDEVNQITLTGTVEYQGLSYDKNDLIVFSKSLLEKNVPKTQEINYNNIKTSVLDIKSKNDEEVEANINIKALLVPKISESKLTKDLQGKSFKNAEDALYKLPQVANVTIKLSPNLPFLPKTLPSRGSNIKILIKING